MAESRRVLRTIVGILICAVLAGCHGKSYSPPQGGAPAPGNPTPTIASLSSTSTPVGVPGFSLVVTGSGFVSGSVVRWNGSDLATTFGGATQLTATVPAANLAFAGTEQVSVASPAPGGGSSATTAFTVVAQIANGTALGGAAASLAINATTELLPVGVASAHVKNRVIMNRLDLRFDPSATVDQVNAALANIGAGIVSMSQGFEAVTIGIPEQSSIADLKALIGHLNAAPGIVHASLAIVAKPLANFFGDLSDPSVATVAAEGAQQLLSERFPAMWNLASTDVFGDPLESPPTLQPCATSPTPVLVADFFDASVPAGLASGLPQLTPSDPPAPDADPDDLIHGYEVATVLGANRFGANPFPFGGCPDLHLVQIANLSSHHATNNIVAHMPAGRFVMNYSAGFAQSCAGDDCLPPTDQFVSPDDYAFDALYWKEKTHDRWDKFLVVAAAGNERDEEGAAIYPGLGDSRFGSVFSIAHLDDNTFQFVAEDSLWTPTGEFAVEGFKTLKPSAAAQTTLAQAVQRAGFAALREDNVIVVGSVDAQADNFATLHVPAEVLAPSDFSDSSPDVLAVGQFAFGLAGTSFAAPQVTGLISFLWMIDPSLRDNQSVLITKRAIVENTRNGVIDAYATALSLDAASIPTQQSAPQRAALLNVNGFAGFDEGDVDIFLESLFVVDANGQVTRQAAPGTVVDFSRYDLNGDGFTTAGARRERFDLDRVNSTQYGATSYRTVSQDIEGVEISFDETGLTDLEILCYYAYSPLYTGDTTERRNMLAGRCGIAVQPTTATIEVGGQQQFTALVPGNGSATWSATCGSVDANGLYTAGGTPGQCSVRATDASIPSVSGTATVTVNAPVGSPVISVTLRTTRSSPNLISAEVLRQNSDTMIATPIGDPAALVTALQSELGSATAIPTVQMSFELPVSLTVSFASYAVTVLNVSDCTTGSAVGANVDVTVADVQNILASSCGGTISVHGATSRSATVQAQVGGRVNFALSGTITRDLFVGECDHGTLNVAVPTVQRHLSIEFDTNCAVTVAATPLQFLEIEDNVNSTIGTLRGGDINELTVSGNNGSTFSVAVGAVKNFPTNSALVTISNNSGVSLSSLDFGDDEGPLTIMNNTGFTDQQAQDFATNQRTVGGTITVSGNH